MLIVFQNFVAYIKTKFSTCIKILRSNNGSKHASHDFQAFWQHMALYLNNHVLMPLNKMSWLNIKIVTCCIWFEHYSYNLQCHLNFGLKLCQLQCIWLIVRLLNNWVLVYLIMFFWCASCLPDATHIWLCLLCSLATIWAS